MRQPKEYHYNKWTDDEINALMRLKNEGKSNVEIAAELGRTYWAVANVIYRLKTRYKK